MSNTFAFGYFPDAEDVRDWEAERVTAAAKLSALPTSASIRGNVLEVFDQATFEHQLRDILAALEAKVGVRLAPAIGQGMRVRIKGGPLQGVEGWVEERYGMTTVLLRLDFINQAAAVKVDADSLELI